MGQLTHRFPMDILVLTHGLPRLVLTLSLKSIIRCTGGNLMSLFIDQQGGFPDCAQSVLWNQPAKTNIDNHLLEWEHAHNYSQWLVVLSRAQSTIWLSLNPCTILGARWLILFCYFQIHAAQRWAEKPRRWIYFFSDFFVHLTNRFRINWLPPHIPIILGLTQASAQSCSVATVITDVFRREKKWINVSNKFMRIMKIFTQINNLKNRGVI